MGAATVARTAAPRGRRPRRLFPALERLQKRHTNACRLPSSPVRRLPARARGRLARVLPLRPRLPARALAVSQGAARDQEGRGGGCVGGAVGAGTAEGRAMRARAVANPSPLPPLQTRPPPTPPPTATPWAPPTTPPAARPAAAGAGRGWRSRAGGRTRPGRTTWGRACGSRSWASTSAPGEEDGEGEGGRAVSAVEPRARAEPLLSLPRPQRAPRRNRAPDGRRHSARAPAAVAPAARPRPAPPPAPPSRRRPRAPRASPFSPTTSWPTSTPPPTRFGTCRPGRWRGGTGGRTSCGS